MKCTHEPKKSKRLLTHKPSLGRLLRLVTIHIKCIEFKPRNFIFYFWMKDNIACLIECMAFFIIIYALFQVKVSFILSHLLSLGMHLANIVKYKRCYDFLLLRPVAIHCWKKGASHPGLGQSASKKVFIKFFFTMYYL